MSDLYRNDSFDLFAENFVGDLDVGMYAVRIPFCPQSRRELRRQSLRRFWRQRLSIRPSSKPCIRVTCLPVEGYWIDTTVIQRHHA